MYVSAISSTSYYVILGINLPVGFDIIALELDSSITSPSQNLRYSFNSQSKFFGICKAYSYNSHFFDAGMEGKNLYISMRHILNYVSHYRVIYPASDIT